jgi:hypothetical protein
MVSNRWEIEPAVARRFVDDGAACIEWLISLGVEFLPNVIPVGPTAVPRGHIAKEYGYGETQALHAALTLRGADIAWRLEWIGCSPTRAAAGSA